MIDAARQNETKLKSLAVVFGLSGAAALPAGAVAGLIVGKVGWGFGLSALPVGLCAGLSIRLLQLEHTKAAWAAVLVATLLSLAVHGAVISAAGSPWSAGRDVDEAEMNFTVQKYLTAQLCREGRIVAFGYDEVPQAVRGQAARGAAEMSTEEKHALVNETFGKRINKGDLNEIGPWAYVPPGLAVLGAAALAIGSLKMRFRRV